MSTITVEPGSLRVTAARIDDVSTTLNRASRRLGSVGIDAIGHPGLAREVDDFVTRWEYTVDRIASAAGATAERLRAAADAYDVTDDAVATAGGGGR